MHDLDEVAAEAAGIMAATAELHERLVQGHRQRPRGDQDAHAYHGRATVRRIRARLDAVGNRPPPESQHPDADAARLAKARQEATEIVAAFERWDRRRQRQPHTKSTEHDGNHHV